MADDADLLISAAFSDAKLAAEVNKVVGKFAEAGKKAQDAFNKTAEGAVDNSRVAQANARRLESLAKSYDPLYRATERYKREVKELNELLASGKFSQDQYSAALARAKGAVEAAGSGVERAGAATRGYGSSLQQVGFQVGDFATQVGAGTSAAQALGQQLPQLLGAFGTLGALAGAGAAILIPLGAALFKMANDAQTAEESLDALGKATDAYSSAADAARTPIADLRAEFGDLADEIQRVSGVQASFLKQLAERNLSATAGLLANEFGGLSTVGEYRGNTQAESDAARTLRKLRSEFEGNETAAKEFMSALERLNTAKGPEQVIKSVEELQKIIADFALAGGDTSGLQAFFTNLSGLAEQAAEQVKSSISEQEVAYSRLIDAYDGDTQALKKLASERAEVEALIANKAGELSDVQIEDLKRVRDEIDKNIAKVKEAAAETDKLLQKQISAYQSYGQSRMQAGQITGGAIDVIKDFEGYRSKPYWDVNAYRAGFGSDTVTLADGSVQKVVQGMTVSLADANRDLIRRVGEFQQGIIGDIGSSRFDSFTQEQQAALTSIAYNYGSLPDRIIEAVRTGTSADIANAIGGLAGDNGGVNADRRRREASAFGSGAPAFAEFEEQQKAEKDAAKETADALKEQVKERERQLEVAKRLSEQLSSNLLTEQQTAEIEKQRAAQTLAINASDLSEADKAAAIAAVNAELEKQITIMKLVEEAKRRNVDLDALMVGSTMTYRQAIEALGETQKQSVLANQQAQAAAAKLGEAQEFAKSQQQQFEEGLVSAITTTGSFGDALKNLAVQMLAAYAQAMLMAGLFGKGPFGGGTGLLSGVWDAISGLPGRATGGPVTAGQAYMVGERGPEPFIPAVNGRILSVQQAQAALRGGQSGGSVSYSPSINIAGDASENTIRLIRGELDRDRSMFFSRWMAAQKQFGTRMA